MSILKGGKTRIKTDSCFRLGSDDSRLCIMVKLKKMEVKKNKLKEGDTRKIKRKIGSCSMQKSNVYKRRNRSKKPGWEVIKEDTMREDDRKISK